MCRKPALDATIVRDHPVWVLDHQAFPKGDNPMASAIGDDRTAATLDAAVFTSGIEPPDRLALIEAVCGDLPDKSRNRAD
jgi:hypothetical protein